MLLLFVSVCFKFALVAKARARPFKEYLTHAPVETRCVEECSDIRLWQVAQARFV